MSGAAFGVHGGKLQGWPLATTMPATAVRSCSGCMAPSASGVGNREGAVTGSDAAGGRGGGAAEERGGLPLIALALV